MFLHPSGCLGWLRTHTRAFTFTHTHIHKHTQIQHTTINLGRGSDVFRQGPPSIMELKWPHKQKQKQLLSLASSSPRATTMGVQLVVTRIPQASLLILGLCVITQEELTWSVLSPFDSQARSQCQERWGLMLCVH